MTEIPVFNPEKQNIGKVKLPTQFEEPVRQDIIKRAVEAIQSHKRQPYGSDPRAGKKSSAKLSRRRRDYKGAYGQGLSRMPRKTMNRRGTSMHWVGAFAPGTVGGRRAHPPTAEKNWYQKINEKERKKAIRSALAATVLPQAVTQRGHFLPKEYPFAISDDFEKIEKTSKVKEALEKLGLKEELQRGEKRKIRAGKGKARGRAYKKPKSILITVTDNCKLLHTARNLPGVEVVPIKNISAMHLAPGAKPGRLTLYTAGAIKKIEEEKLFL